MILSPFVISISFFSLRVMQSDKTLSFIVCCCLLNLHFPRLWNNLMGFWGGCGMLWLFVLFVCSSDLLMCSLCGFCLMMSVLIGVLCKFEAAAPTWVQYDLNTGETLYDIDFDEKDPNHGSSARHGTAINNEMVRWSIN